VINDAMEKRRKGKGTEETMAIGIVARRKILSIGGYIGWRVQEQ